MESKSKKGIGCNKNKHKEKGLALLLYINCNFHKKKKNEKVLVGPGLNTVHQMTCLVLIYIFRHIEGPIVGYVFPNASMI